MAGPADFYLGRLQPLLGGKIVGLIRSGEPDEFFGFQILGLKGDRWDLWFYQDDEGNGPGSFSLEKLRPAKKTRKQSKTKKTNKKKKKGRK